VDLLNGDSELKMAIKLAPERVSPARRWVALLKKKILTQHRGLTNRPQAPARFMRAHNDLGLALMQNRDPDGAIQCSMLRSSWTRMIWWPSIIWRVLIQRAIMPGCRGVSSATLTGADNAEAHYGLDWL